MRVGTGGANRLGQVNGQLMRIDRPEDRDPERAAHRAQEAHPGRRDPEVGIVDCALHDHGRHRHAQSDAESEHEHEPGDLDIRGLVIEKG